MKSESKTFVLKSILLILPNSFNFWIKSRRKPTELTFLLVTN